MPNLDIMRQHIADLSTKLETIHAAAGDRALTETEQRDWDAFEAERAETLTNLDAARAEEERHARVAEARARWNGATTAAGVGYLNLRNLTDDVRYAASRAGGFEVRALLAAGTTAATPAILSASPVSLGKPATSLLDILPARVVQGGVYSYLRQTARTSNAAPVAVGAQKPTSVMTLTRVDGRLEVVAHLSEAIHEPWLKDNLALEQFVQTELADGIASALEDQLLNGTGVSPELDGIIGAATGTQAYATSVLTTIRTGLSKFEAAGLTASAVVLSAADWLAIETSTLAAGNYVLGTGPTGAPLDAVRRTLWSVPVVVSPAHTAGTAVLISADSVGLVTDGGVQFQWGQIATDFELNQVRGRAEVRAQVEVFRPDGIVIADLTA